MVGKCLGFTATRPTLDWIANPQRGEGAFQSLGPTPVVEVFWAEKLEIDDTP